MIRPRQRDYVQYLLEGGVTDVMRWYNIEEFTEPMMPPEFITENIVPYEEEVDNPREKFFWHLTLELGFLSVRTQLEWINSVIERLQNQQLPSLSE